ncbi:MAG: C4-type zinc ribbon domain-containing protein [Actinomycetota bacterium]|nr:C4-type zinc ribbon domain-containing protein [Actinomycetota bacterium]
MKATLREQHAILNIQNFDFTFSTLTNKAASRSCIWPIHSLTIKVDNARDLRIAAETEHSDVKRELARAEGDVEQIVTRINRDEARLASGTPSPKELEQLQHEIGTLGVRRTELEEIELEIMMRIDGIKARITELSEQESALAAEITELEIKKANALAVINADIDATKSDRASEITSISAELVALYEKIRASNNGTGAAALVGNQCKGCHLTVNNVELQRIASLAEDEVVRCEECRCILVRGL